MSSPQTPLSQSAVTSFILAGVMPAWMAVGSGGHAVAASEQLETPGLCQSLPVCQAAHPERLSQPTSPPQRPWAPTPRPTTAAPGSWLADEVTETDRIHLNDSWSPDSGLSA